MLSTVTAKGRVTVPKAIRDRLSIEPGSRLDFAVNGDGTILVRPLRRSALFIVGISPRPGQPAMSIEQMNDAIAEEASARQRRTPK